MTHKYRITTDADVPLSDLNDSLESATFDHVLSDRDQSFSTRETIDGDDEHRATVYAADAESRADVLDELKSVVDDATTAEITHRHTFAEYDDERIDDPEYYNHDADSGHRTNPTVDRAGGFDLEVSASVHLSGDEYDHDSSVEIPAPSKYARMDRLVADADGIDRLEGTPTDAPIGDIQPPETPDDAVPVATIIIKEHIDRIPHGGIAVDELVGKSSDTTSVYEK